jgi:DNA-binding NarL/FixJ family response regulator
MGEPRLFAGGASCVAKEASAENILAAVHIAAEGRRVFAADDGHLVERGHPATVASLTSREAEVLEFLSRGQSHAEIAHALGLGVETVRTHAAHIRGKLGVRSKRELIARVHRMRRWDRLCYRWCDEDPASRPGGCRSGGPCR